MEGLFIWHFLVPYVVENTLNRLKVKTYPITRFILKTFLSIAK